MSHEKESELSSQRPDSRASHAAEPRLGELKLVSSASSNDLPVLSDEVHEADAEEREKNDKADATPPAENSQINPHHPSAYPDGGAKAWLTVVC
jgi:hypothetical protein